MGPRAVPPPLPELEVNMLPEGAAKPQMTLHGGNWLQTIEGDLDTAHLGFLHLGSVRPEDTVPGQLRLLHGARTARPEYEVMDAEHGTTYAAYRPADDGGVYWRIAHFMFPFYTLIPTGALGAVIRGQFWVPLDDHNTMYWGWQVTNAAPAGRDGARGSAANADTGRPVGAAGRGGFTYLPNTTDWLGRWRLDQNMDNDYLIDREKQKTGEIWTGVRGVRQQDKVVTEGMGPMMNRISEHLGTSDSMIIHTRKRLLRAVKALEAYGEVPPGVDQPEVYRSRSGSIILPQGVDWLTATEHLRKPAVAIGEPVFASTGV